MELGAAIRGVGVVVIGKVGGSSVDGGGGGGCMQILSGNIDHQ